MTRGRRLAWALTAASAATFVGAIVPMAQRVRAYNAGSHFLRLHAEPRVDRHFKLAGFPEVHLTDALGEKGQALLKLQYGQAPLRMIPVVAPAGRDLPVLAGYEEWVKVLAINEVELDAQGRSVPKPGTEKLLIVVRRTPEGFDPGAWGSVRRVEWLFDFYDLKPDGSIASSTYRWPRSERSERNLHNRNASDAPKPEEQELEKIPRLSERSIEYFAAMHVIPKLNVPEHKFTDTALRPEVLGWTLPTAMGSLLVMAGALAFALAPRGVVRVNPNPLA